MLNVIFKYLTSIIRDVTPGVFFFHRQIVVREEGFSVQIVSSECGQKHLLFTAVTETQESL